MRSKRAEESGSILLEALIAFALITAFAVTVLTTLMKETGSESGRAGDFWLAEYARSKAEELSELPGPLERQGQDPGGWQWKIGTERTYPDGKSPFDKDLALYRLTLSVWNAGDPSHVVTAGTILTRKP